MKEANATRKARLSTAVLTLFWGLSRDHSCRWATTGDNDTNSRYSHTATPLTTQHDSSARAVSYSWIHVLGVYLAASLSYIINLHRRLALACLCIPAFLLFKTNTLTAFLCFFYSQQNNNNNNNNTNTA
jgi:hypothetical protein